MVENIYLLVLPAVLLPLAVCARVHLSSFLAQRALVSLIRRFRELDALDSRAAVSIDKLGFRTSNPGSSSLKTAAGSRSYKPQALLHLISQGAVLVTGDNRLYLSEETLELLGFS